jgi:hypothetical protein
MSFSQSCSDAIIYNQNVTSDIVLIKAAVPANISLPLDNRGFWSAMTRLKSLFAESQAQCQKETRVVKGPSSTFVQSFGRSSDHFRSLTLFRNAQLEQHLGKNNASVHHHIHVQRLLRRVAKASHLAQSKRVPVQRI